MTFIDYVVLVAYFAVMAVIGFACMRMVKGQEDFFMGGRGFGRLFQTFAAFGAGTGAHEPPTVGRTVWTSGLSGIWSALAWLFVTPFYWITGVWYRRMRHLTLGDWFVERYESRAMGAAYTGFAIVFYMFYLSTMFSAIGNVAAPLILPNQDTTLVTVWGGGTIGLEYILVPAIAAGVIVYGVLGGLRAAYWTDLIQGIFIILLSIMLIPYGLKALVAKFGDPSTMGMMDGFRIMHERVPEDYFRLFGGPQAGEFPIYYLAAFTLLMLVGIVVHPHFIATGGGSAKNENSARVGLVVGNFLKRFCTVGWGLTALIIVALMADSPILATNPDRVWGVATSEILGPLNIGLVGLMLACLLAALMSSADAYMIVTSGCVVRNVYAAYINPHASEATYVRVARATGMIVIVGAVAISLWVMDVFGQFKLAIELPILFAAPFWVGMWWRRATRQAVWLTMGFSLLVFFAIPILAPLAMPGLRTDPAFTATNERRLIVTPREATPADVERRQAEIEAGEGRRQAAMQLADPVAREAALAQVAPAPQPLTVGDPVEERTVVGGRAIFWTDGVAPQEGARLVEVSRGTDAAGRTVIVQRWEGPMRGSGNFNLDFLLYQWMGMDLTTRSNAMLETLRLPSRLFAPFLVLIVLSFFTPRNSKEALDRYYAKMKTPVDPDRGIDAENLRRAYENPAALESRKLFPGTEFEASKPTAVDVIGFLACFGVCLAIVGLIVWMGTIGA